MTVIWHKVFYKNPSITRRFSCWTTDFFFFCAHVIESAHKFCNLRLWPERKKNPEAACVGTQTGSHHYLEMISILTVMRPTCPESNYPKYLWSSVGIYLEWTRLSAQQLWHECSPEGEVCHGETPVFSMMLKLACSQDISKTSSQIL